MIGRGERFACTGLSDAMPQRVDARSSKRNHRSMGFLANLLPGIRELRAPLAAGYIVLVAAWIGAAPDIPVDPDHGSLADSVSRALSSAGTVERLSAVTFMSFLVGSIVEALTTPLFRLRLIDPGYGFRLPGRFLTHDAERSMEMWEDSILADLRLRENLNWVAAAFRLDAWLASLQGHSVLATAGSWPDVSENGAVRPESFVMLDSIPRGESAARALLRWGVAIEMDRILVRLLLQQSSLHDLIDRLRGEAEFRWAVSLPLAALGLVVLVRYPSIWAAAAAIALATIAIILVALGRAAQRRANGYLVDALVLEKKAAPPALEQLLNGVPQTVNQKVEARRDRAEHALRRRMEIAIREIGALQLALSRLLQHPPEHDDNSVEAFNEALFELRNKFYAAWIAVFDEDSDVGRAARRTEEALFKLRRSPYMSADGSNDSASGDTGLFDAFASEATKALVSPMSLRVE